MCACTLGTLEDAFHNITRFTKKYFDANFKGERKGEIKTVAKSHRPCD